MSCFSIAIRLARDPSEGNRIPPSSGGPCTDGTRRGRRTQSGMPRSSSRTRRFLDREAILRAQKLRFIAVAATGTNIVDLKACAERGIIVSNIRNYAINTVPEHTFALIFALRRSIVAYREAVIHGRWQEAGQFCFFDYPIRDLAGSTLGIMGDGVLGRAVADIGRAPSMRILFSTRARKGWAAVHPLRRSHPHQRHHHAALPADAFHAEHDLASRVRHDGALPAAHQHGAWRAGGRGGPGRGAENRADRQGADADVVTSEPPPADHPLMKLAGKPNFILTPHVAWASREAIQALADQLIDNVEAFQSGCPELRRRVMSDPRSILHSLFAAAVASADPASGRPERSAFAAPCVLLSGGETTVTASSRPWAIPSSSTPRSPT